ncbi:MAG TPA: hypothetical protein VHC96_05815 [Puia sp.]|jgi:hypothetical protein|nr:hypothetical protein [Puia sp.]
MNSNLARQRLIKKVQEEFTKTYPFLKIDFSKGKDQGRTTRTGASPDMLPSSAGEDEAACDAAQNLLWQELGICDDMKINEVEVLLQYHFGVPAQVLRKSGNLWMETRMTQHWTLRQQNEHGYEIDKDFR